MRCCVKTKVKDDKGVINTARVIYHESVIAKTIFPCFSEFIACL